MKGINGAIIGRFRSHCRRSGGAALASACRTTWRCTPSLRAMPSTVPAPDSYSLRICSHSPTFAFLSNPRLLLLQQEASGLRGGPFYSIDMSRFRISKSRAEPIIYIGDSGTGKTHLLTRLAVAACRQKRRVRFTSAAGLVNELVEA
jgi:hypothetical protein